MSYTADDHDKFSRRLQRLMLRFQACRDEAAKLQEIYTNEALSGSAEEFVGNAIASEQEHIDGILYLSSFAAFNENDAVSQVDRTQWITPFVQVEE